VTERRRADGNREKLLGELQHALESVPALPWLLPIYAACKKIRDEWKSMSRPVGKFASPTASVPNASEICTDSREAPGDVRRERETTHSLTSEALCRPGERTGRDGSRPLVLSCGSRPTLDRVVADVDEPNAASIRVLERVGLVRTWRAVVQMRPLLYYGLTRKRRSSDLE
jgi:hypothetical protein